MKIITYSKIGLNHPTLANWSYGIWKVDIIDDTKQYNISFTAKETFGGDSRFRRALEEANIKVIETRGVYTKTGTPKITGISDLPILDSEEFISEVINLIN